MTATVVDHFLFDLDGTLLDSEILYIEAVGTAIRQRGGQLDAEGATQLVYGRSWHDIFAEVGRRWPGAWPRIDEMEAAVRSIFMRLEQERDISIPGSVYLLQSLAQHYPVAIVSGSPREDVARCVAHLGIEPCLRFFLGAEDYSPGKPHPAGYLAAARRFGVEPSRCLVFEDSSAGVTAAKAAGMHCVALKRPGAPEQEVGAADVVLSDLSHFDPGQFRIPWPAPGGH
ncbi:MAG: HAD family hydrolase [Acidobacteriota bacterium]